MASMNAMTIAREFAETSGVAPINAFNALKRGIARGEIKARIVTGIRGGRRYHLNVREATRYLQHWAETQPVRQERPDTDEIVEVFNGRGRMMTVTAQEVMNAFPEADLYTSDQVIEMLEHFMAMMTEQDRLWESLYMKWGDPASDDLFNICVEGRRTSIRHIQHLSGVIREMKGE